MPSLAQTRDLDLWKSGIVTLASLARSPVLDGYRLCDHRWGPVVIEFGQHYQFCRECSRVKDYDEAKWYVIGSDDHYYEISDDGPTTADLVAIRLLYSE